MSRVCPHEDALLAVVLEERALTSELAAHLETCASCRDLQLLTAALRDERADALAAAHVPSAGVLWWRAERRARLEAAQAAARPITVAAGLAMASAIGALASLAGVLAWWWRDGLDMPGRLAQASTLLSSGLAASPTGLRLAVWLAAGALLLATPLAWYVATREEK